MSVISWKNVDRLMDNMTKQPIVLAAASRGTAAYRERMEPLAAYPLPHTISSIWSCVSYSCAIKITAPDKAGGASPGRGKGGVCCQWVAASRVSNGRRLGLKGILRWQTYQAADRPPSTDRQLCDVLPPAFSYLKSQGREERRNDSEENFNVYSRWKLPI